MASLLDNDHNHHPKKPVAPQFKVRHYYGDVVRKLFMAMAILMLVAIPFDQELLTLYARVGIFLVLILTLLAGFTSPRSKRAIAADMVISGTLFVIFEYVAIGLLQEGGPVDVIFLLRQLIALTALVALYYSTKTFRGYVLHQ